MRQLVACVLIASMGLFVLGGCGGGSPVYVAVSHPAERALPAEIKTIAVTQFTGLDRDSQSYAQVASGVLASKLTGAGQCKIVERMNLKDVLKEQDLSEAGITDKAAAGRAGALLNADALIFGTVQVRAVRSTITKTKTTFDANGNARQVPVQVPRITAQVSMNFRLVNLVNADGSEGTGSVLVSKSTSHQYDSNEGKSDTVMFGESTSGSDIPPVEQLIQALATRCVLDFNRVISPHVDVFEVELAGCKSEAGKSGVAMAQSGDWAQAVSLFEEAAKQSGESRKDADVGAMYDLGVARMMLGDAAGAKKAIDQAIRMKADKKFIATSAKLNQAMGDGRAAVRAATAEEIAEYQQTVGVTAKKKKRMPF